MLSPWSLSLCTAGWCDWKESPAHFVRPGPVQACDLGPWLSFAGFHHSGPEKALALQEGRPQHAQWSQSDISKAKLSMFLPQAKNASMAPCGPQDQVQILELFYKPFVIWPVFMHSFIFCHFLLLSLWLQTFWVFFRSSWAGLFLLSDTTRAPQVSLVMDPSHGPDMFCACLDHKDISCIRPEGKSPCLLGSWLHSRWLAQSLSRSNDWAYDFYKQKNVIVQVSEK